MGGHGAIEVAKTVLEVADVAWTAMEVTHNHHHHHDHENHGGEEAVAKSPNQELESIILENRRLRNLLEHNLKLLQDLSDSPCLINDCPPHLYDRLVATVDSENFMTRLESLQRETLHGNYNAFPFKEATGDDVQSAEILIKVDHEEPSWWVWVTDEMVPSNVEERSGIDDDSYMVIGEEHVVDGVADFMAKCILSNPKAQNMTPKDLQKTLSKALGSVSKVEKMLNIWHAGKMFYALSTWGLALTGLYRSRAVLRLAATGLHATGKVVLRTL
ncbi:hypothetical protein CFOL_v3_27567 [Cephalotus follicularis]|uniref:Uncharacterized protein n=1 Tax=Cephalotus follicularis TaxID=3775 RepID=A0A1Q3CVP1_CEPFO|nr:hypothetical protein CFOL_v3_27567 [Cephalotus follicularis]